MGQKRTFLLTLSFFLTLLGFSGYPGSKATEAEKIDVEIAELEGIKRGYEARALKHEDTATYLQFDTQAVLETRRHLQLADENRRKAALIQERIDRLEARRAELAKR